MTAASPSNVLAALGCLLAVATSAAAQCGWVLWAQSVGPAGFTYLALDGWQEREACESERTRRLQQPQDPAKQVFLSCLPDTLDPRPPKRGK
jgi:hypothetical protein